MRMDASQARYMSLYMNQFLMGAAASAFHSLPTAINRANSYIAQTINADPNDTNIIYISLVRTASMDALIDAFNGFFHVASPGTAHAL